MANSLADEYPWIEFLPVDQRREFVGNYFRLLRASAKLGTFGRVTELLNSWEGTAEAYALGLEPVAIDRNFLASDEALVPAPRIMAKKDMEVLRPAKTTEYTLKFGSTAASKGWGNFKATANNALADAWDHLVRHPEESSERCYPFKGQTFRLSELWRA